MRLSSYGVYGYALLCSPTLEKKIEFCKKYQRVMGAMTDFIVVRGENEDIYRHFPTISETVGDELSRFALEFTMSAQLRLMQDLYGSEFRFHAIRMNYEEPGHVAAYRRLFQCPLHFGQKDDEVSIGGAWLERRPRYPDLFTYSQIAEICDEFLKHLPHTTGVAAAIRRRLFEKCLTNVPKVEAMARDLSMHVRTLRRRLESQGTTYSRIVAEVRQALAINYLCKSSMSIDEIAHRLGYSDASNFRHAFVRWMKTTPSEYRKGGAQNRQ